MKRLLIATMLVVLLAGCAGESAQCCTPEGEMYKFLADFPDQKKVSNISCFDNECTGNVEDSRGRVLSIRARCNCETGCQNIGN